MTTDSPARRPTTESFSPGPSHAREYRTALGAFATGVTVVTCRGNDGPLGFTANSFASVSIDPPLVLWCPAVTSLRHDAFVAAHDFAIHFLEASQLALSERFSGDARDFEGLDWVEGAKGVPCLEGCLTRLDCRHFAAHGAGDHTVIVGQVEKVTHTPGAPLLFALGAYGRFSGGI